MPLRISILKCLQLPQVALDELGEDEFSAQDFNAAQTNQQRKTTASKIPNGYNTVTAVLPIVLK
jgi:hypothetical protein